MIQPDDTTHGKELQNETNPIYILPVTITSINGIPSNDGSNDHDNIDQAVRETNSNMAELVGHQLWNRAHGHLTEAGAKTCYAKTSGQMRGRPCCSRDDEADAADCVADDENNTTSEEITVGSREDEADRIGSRVSRY